MASLKLHIGTIRGCPQPKQLADALTDLGLPDDGPHGVLNHNATADVVYATIVRRTFQAVQRIETDSRDIVSAEVERVALYPFAVRPKAEIIEVYAGGTTALKHIEAFCAEAIAVPVVVEPIELDIPAAIDKLAKKTQRFALRSVRVADYAHNSYMAGPYTPKFLDSIHGMEFLEEYAESVTTASVRFAGETGRVTVTLKPTAAFSYTCNEDDQPAVQSLLRTLL